MRMKFQVFKTRNNYFAIIDIYYYIGQITGLCPYSRIKNKNGNFIYCASGLTWNNGIVLIGLTLCVLSKSSDCIYNL